LLKAVFDSLEHAGLYDDDSQIIQFSYHRRGPEKPGRLEITITPLEAAA